MRWIQTKRLRFGQYLLDLVNGYNLFINEKKGKWYE